MRPARLLAPVAALIALGGCGIQPTGVSGVAQLPAAQGPVVTNKIYFVKGGGLVPVLRPGLPGSPLMPLWQLGYGVTDNERKAGFTSTLPGVGIATGLPDSSLHQVPAPDAPPEAPPPADQDSGTVTVALQTTIRPERWPREWKAQIACTAEAIPGVRKVELNIFDGRPGLVVRCDDFRDLLNSGPG
ncbi:hypothetical protein [Actinomadura gamaensis]|uniref:Lipoprotein n=1 Tax=Actinomadura gamaensis TaxID=1763541 RepID=A0ABV9U023_9ACTN